MLEFDRQVDSEERSGNLVIPVTNVCPDQCGEEFSSGKFDQQVDSEERSGNLVNPVTSNVCPDQRGKEFSSGNAMDGHRRIHTQAICEKENIEDVHKLTDHDQVLPSSDQFPSSLRALKFRIRRKEYNPKRFWTEFQPQESKEHNDEFDDIQTQNSSIAVIKPVENLCASLRGWGKTRKRGLTELLPNSDSESEEGASDIDMPDENIKDAIHESEGASDIDMPDDQNIKDAIHESERASDNDMPDENIKDAINEGVLKLSQLQRPDSSIDSDTTISTPTLEEEGSTDVYDSPRSTSSSRKRKIADFVLEEGSDRRYMCTICGKCFDKPQALGGHKSSHNKPPKKVKVKSEDLMHRCNICNETFPTGMALGGHKRKHRNAALAEAAGSSTQEISSSEEVVKPYRVGFYLDLNELPPADD
ncbi:hypothetical protein ACFE04_024482 [Oxalis oulophora]